MSVKPSEKMERKAILVVDDHDAVRESLCDILSLRGYIVRSVSNGLDALSECDANLYDLVIVDIRMPGINGVESIRQIQDLLDYRPNFIAMSAYAVDVLREEADRLGVIEFFSKPLEIPKLIQAIEKVLTR